MVRRLTRRRVMTEVAASAAAAFLVSGRSARAAPRNHEVRITGFAFVPRVLEVRAGDTITWTNDDLAPHTATADEYGWNTGELAKGQSQKITVTEDMETHYFCAFHPHMKGSLKIV